MAIVSTLLLAAASFNAIADSKANDKELTTCSNATLKGTYLYADQTDSIAYAGMKSFDGDGNTKALVSVTGSNEASTTSGTYKVNSSCTGTYTSSGPSADPYYSYTTNLFIDPDGSVYTVVGTRPTPDIQI